MKAFKRVMVIAISLLICAGCSSDENNIPVDQTALKYFQNSYEKCRERFRKLSKGVEKRFSGVEIFQISVKSRIDDNLTIDCLYIPAQVEKRKLVVLSAGVHGVEGFTGSAIQQMFLEEILSTMDLEYTGIFFIHAVNPYGFKYWRRVTENNVDLNRNADVDRALFSYENDGYARLTGFLNPKDKVDLGRMRNQFFFIRSVVMILKYSMKSLRQATLQGQYEFEKGIWFGGKDFEPQIQSIKMALTSITRDYRSVFGIDLHSGYGERYKLHLFPNPISDEKVKGALETIFKGYTIDWGDSDDFYFVTGEFATFVGKLIPEKFFLPMCFEYGTTDSQTTRGAVRSIHTMILENQGYHYGYAGNTDERKVKERFREMFFPSSDKWRSEVIRKTRELLPLAIKRYQILDPEKLGKAIAPEEVLTRNKAVYVSRQLVSASSGILEKRYRWNCQNPLVAE